MIPRGFSLSSMLAQDPWLSAHGPPDLGRSMIQYFVYIIGHVAVLDMSEERGQALVHAISSISMHFFEQKYRHPPKISTIVDCDMDINFRGSFVLMKQLLHATRGQGGTQRSKKCNSAH